MRSNSRNISSGGSRAWMLRPLPQTVPVGKAHWELRANLCSGFVFCCNLLLPAACPQLSFGADCSDCPANMMLLDDGTCEYAGSVP
jgi:hypothetical protein